MPVPPTAPVVLLVFANDRYDPGAAYLRNLAAEREAIRQALEPLGPLDDWLRIESNITLARFADRLTIDRERIVGVHFAGHAHPDGLRFEDPEGRPIPAHIDGLAEQLAALPNLRWICLNGCATRDHVVALHARLDVPAIATSRAVEDAVATEFATRFYAALGRGDSLRAAFDATRAHMRSRHRAPAAVLRAGEASCLRHLKPGAAPAGDVWPWVLETASSNPTAADWRLKEALNHEPAVLDRWRDHVRVKYGEDDPEDQRPRVDLGLASLRDPVHDDITPTGDDRRTEDASPRPRTLRCVMRRRPSQPVPRWWVVGEPGAGKSTMARRLTAALADDEETGIAVYLPLVPLTRERQHPFDAAEAELAAFMGEEKARGLSAALRTAATIGRVWLLLDGLDEVEESEQDLHGLLRGWANNLSTTPIAVLGRPVGSVPPRGFDRLHVIPLDTHQQAILLKGWLGDDMAAPVIGRLAIVPWLRRLGANPLVLKCIAAVAEEGGADPFEYTALFEKVLGELLARSSRCGRSGLRAPVSARRLLGAISVALHRRKDEAWPERDVRHALETALTSGHADQHDRQECGGVAQLLADLPRRSGVLGPFRIDDERWQFLHPALRVALAAEHLASRTAHLVQTLRELASAHLDAWGPMLGMACAWPRDGIDTDARARASRQMLAWLDSEVPGLLLSALPYAELSPSDGMALLAERAGYDDPAKYGEDYRRLVIGWGYAGEGAEALLAQVDANKTVEWLAVVHYALCAAGMAIDDGDFFRRAGRPMAEPADLTRIDGGTFEMGSPESDDWRAPDEVQRSVTVPAFELGATAVTRAEYAAFDPTHRSSGTDRHPVTEVTWYAARLYAAWRGARLPTESEWEFACRADTTTRFSSGDSEQDLARVGWYRGNSADELRPVGEKPCNPFGLYDMHGNVSEWCADWYDDRAQRELVQWELPRRVARGGNARSEARLCRSTCREGAHPDSRGYELGFRLARCAAPPRASAGRSARPCPRGVADPADET